LGLAQFRELEAFAQFGSDLDAATKRQLDLGRRLEELLKQSQYSPVPVERQVIQIYVATNEMLSDVKVEKVQPFIAGLMEYIENNAGDLFTEIREELMYDETWEEKLKSVVAEFASTADQSYFIEKQS